MLPTSKVTRAPAKGPSPYCQEAAIEYNAREQRKHTRLKVNWPARCVFGDQGAVDVMIIDASRGGVGLNCSLSAPVLDYVTIVIERIGTFTCRLAWKGNHECGLEFVANDKCLSEADVNELAGALAEELNPAN
jgi:hypothetical protein